MPPHCLAHAGAIISDPFKFPSGMKALGDWIHTQSVPGKGKVMKYGLYTCRGTCQCSTALYNGPGSHGFVEQDAMYLADAGADYLKEVRNSFLLKEDIPGLWGQSF